MTPNIQQHVVPRHYNYDDALSRGSTNNQTVALALGMITLFLGAILGFFYLQQVLGNASQGSNIYTLEARINELKERQRQLELEGAELRSMRTIEQHIEKLNLAPTSAVAYLVPTTDRVALVEE